MDASSAAAAVAAARRRGITQDGVRSLGRPAGAVGEGLSRNLSSLSETSTVASSKSSLLQSSFHSNHSFDTRSFLKAARPIAWRITEGFSWTSKITIRDAPTREMPSPHALMEPKKTLASVGLIGCLVCISVSRYREFLCFLFPYLLMTTLLKCKSDIK
uniref:Uncharacterized protein n=2 Tax=Oryza TaxID=4527 RepID=A0A0E0NQ46_ORYRU